VEGLLCEESNDFASGKNALFFRVLGNFSIILE